MARIRTIKPEFFLHEDLAELSAMHRLLFAGLWCIADKEGRFEDRPKRIKAEVLPYDDCDVDRMLGDLARAGFVRRYEAAGKRCIAIPSFSEHQRPHPKEADSSLPPPPALTKDGASREKDEPRQDLSTERTSGREGKGRSLRKESQEGEGASEAAAPAVASSSELALTGPGVAPPSPEDLQKLWNEIVVPAGLPRWIDMSDKRRKAARKRLEAAPLSRIRAQLERIARSNFATGRKPGKTWRMPIDFFLASDTSGKIEEGQYDDGDGVAAPPAPTCTVPGCSHEQGERTAGKPVCDEHFRDWERSWRADAPRGDPDFGAAHFAAWLSDRQEVAA